MNKIICYFLMVFLMFGTLQAFLVFHELDLLDNQKVLRSYTWGLDTAGTRQEVGGIGALLSVEVTQPDDTKKDYLYLNDAGGNIVKVLDATTSATVNSYEYGPYGQVIAKSETIENHFQYNTKYLDEETGLLYYGYRFYDDSNGRWINRDPIGVEGGINLYNSVSNNMVNGYSGGLSLSGGMELEINDFVWSENLDEWGLEIKHVPTSQLQNISSFYPKDHDFLTN